MMRGLNRCLMLLAAGWGCSMAVAAAEPAPAASVDPATLPDSQYVTVRDGHLWSGGQRVRIWAAIGKTFLNSNAITSDTPQSRAKKVDLARRGTDLLMQRYADLGFNGVRMWVGFNKPSDYKVGDGSAMDDADYFVAQAGKKGMRIWMAALNSVDTARAKDVNIIDDPVTADQWAKAVGSGRGERSALARTWDPRLEALAIKQMTTVATHLNRHNGLRWCDDPTFAVWELSNEEWWMQKMVGGQWQNMPPFFRTQLIGKWNAFLKNKYGTTDKLTAAWKALLPGESMESESILLVPMAGKSRAAVALNDANPAARAAIQQVDQEYSRGDFSTERGGDVIEFFLGLQLAHKQRESAAIKALGRSTQLCPMVYDTGIGYEIQSQFLQQNADAVAHDAYTNGWGPDFDEKMKEVDMSTSEQRKALAIQDAERISANHNGWVNWLLKPPGLHQGVPWLEHNRVPGKPYFAYETQIQQPAKYRADYPLRIAALAAIQDWDWICWHYFQPPDDLATDPHPWDKAMDVTVAGHPQGYHYTYDAVQNSAMRLASRIFRDGLLATPANPTVFIYGRKSLYDPASMDYAGSYGMSGLDMNYTTYQYGVRIQIDPTRQDDQVIGPAVKFADRNTHNPYTPTDQIVYDWKKGYVTFDAPAVVAFTGLLAHYGSEVKFKNGVTLSDVQIKNDPGLFDPVGDDEKYITFALASDDGKPLAETKKASLSLVSTSFNKGFKLLPLKPNQPLCVPGSLPVLYARVGATIQAPALDGMKYTLRDWHMKGLGHGIVAGGSLIIPADKPVFIVELNR